MAATRSVHVSELTTAATPLTVAETGTTPPWRRRTGRFLLRVLGELGRHPSVWDPWLLLTPHRAWERTSGGR
jgi:hypothetical protein